MNIIPDNQLLFLALIYDWIFKKIQRIYLWSHTI